VVERAVFINYRGEDSHSYGALLHRDLTVHFGEKLVFLDAECIPAGADFVEELLGRVRSALVLLAVIGRRWLTATDSTGRRRIDAPDDWIHRELAEAFAAGVRVIPVLTDEAELPCETDLPADIAALSRCQYRRLRRREPTSDLARLVVDLIDLDPVLAAAARNRDDKPHRQPPASGSRVDEQLHLLARASRQQWTAAANDRRLLHPAPLPVRWHHSTAPVAGPASATGYPRFDPLPGMTAIGSGDVREGTQQALHQVYGGLPSGRLLLIGPPGSGKTATAILLLLDALHYRDQAAPDDKLRIPVPVLFTLHGWDPDRGDSAADWMAGKLAETYPMFRGRVDRQAATDLLATGQVAAFLDGLDEIPESVRPSVLHALADAPFRLVLLTRTTEAVAAAHRGPLAGAVAVELQPVAPADAAAYLLQNLVDPPPAVWRTISDHLTESADHRRTSAVSEAMHTPLALSLLRDVYGPTGPADELLDASRFPTAAAVENHLLDHAVAAAYTPRPGHPAPRYSVATAQHTLRYLATQLTERGTRDLAWWHIPSWASHRSQLIRAAVINLLANGLLCGLALGLVFGPTLGLVAGVVFGLVGVVPALAGRRREHRRGVITMPQRIARLTYRNTLRSLAFGLVSGLSGGLLAGLSAGLAFGLSAGLVSGLPVGLAAGLTGVALRAIARHTDVDESSLGPADVWRHDRNAGLVCLPLSALMVGLLAMLTARLVPGLAWRLESRPLVVLSVGLVVGLVLGLVVAVMAKRMGPGANSAGAAAMETAVDAVRLTIQHKVPLRLIAFLEDARSRHLLRTVGPVYQFRHAKLQDRLAQPTRNESFQIPGHTASCWPTTRTLS
jgi:hypothetical protein